MLDRLRGRRRSAGASVDAALERLVRTAVDGPGFLDPATRRAAYLAAPLADPAAAAYADTVNRHAYRVTDAQVEALLGSGWSEAQVLELTIAAALGAGRRRLDAGLAALGGGG